MSSRRRLTKSNQWVADRDRLVIAAGVAPCTDLVCCWDDAVYLIDCCIHLALAYQER